MNAYDSGARRMVPAVLVYQRRGESFLMIHRNARAAAEDYHSGRWNGLGGKCEPDESPAQAARRELREESGYDRPEASLPSLGYVLFPNFKPHRNEDWMVFVFDAELPPE